MKITKEYLLERYKDEIADVNFEDIEMGDSFSDEEENMIIREALGLKFSFEHFGEKFRHGCLNIIHNDDELDDEVKLMVHSSIERIFDTLIGAYTMDIKHIIALSISSSIGMINCDDEEAVEKIISTISGQED